MCARCFDQHGTSSKQWTKLLPLFQDCWQWTVAPSACVSRNDFHSARMTRYVHLYRKLLHNARYDSTETQMAERPTSKKLSKLR